MKFRRFWASTTVRTNLLRSSCCILLLPLLSLAQQNKIAVSPPQPLTIKRGEKAIENLQIEVLDGFHVNSDRPKDDYEALADKLALPRAAVAGPDADTWTAAELVERNIEVSITPFIDPDPFQEFTYPNAVAAKRAIADYLGMPLAKLDPRQLDQIDRIVGTTLEKKRVMEAVRQCLNQGKEGSGDVE
jgi:hypothetical protein